LSQFPGGGASLADETVAVKAIRPGSGCLSDHFSGCQISRSRA
jgi:hypothetical protein